MDHSKYFLRLQGAGPSPTLLFWPDPYRARKSPCNQPISAETCRKGAEKGFPAPLFGGPYSCHVRPAGALLSAPCALECTLCSSPAGEERR